MKKFFIILMILSLITCLTPCVHAENKNLLNTADSTFEGGSHNWKVFADGALKVTDNPSGEGKVLEYSGCPEPNETSQRYKWSAFTLDIKPYITKNVTEATTLYIAMDVYTTGNNARIPLLIRTEKADDLSLCQEAGTPYVELTDSETRADFQVNTWTRFQIEFEITDDDLASSAKYWNICFNGLYLAAGTGNIYIDNVYLSTEPDPTIEEEEAENKPIPEKAVITRSGKTLVGTIRWDAFNRSTAGGKDVASQVANVLSPKKYHNQVPFFASIGDTVSFPEYTLDIWEQEADFAKNAGLDYFAYLWYETTDPMSNARKMHLLSDKKDTVKMAGILETVRAQKTMDELFNAMKDPCYLTLSGHPVLFLYDMPKWTKEKITSVRQMAVNAGIEKALYIIGMDHVEKNISSNLQKGVDGISWYGTAPTKTAQSFSELAKYTEELTVNMGKNAMVYNFDLVPSFTTGRDCRARIETGVSWIEGDPKAADDKDKPYKNLYSLQPTMEELASHVAYMYNYVKDNPLSAKSNLLLSYGWNEHEEGGWLCPTIKCDGNGDPVLDANGKVTYNTERIDTLRATLEKLKSTPSATPTLTATAEPSASAAPSVTPEIENSGNFSFNLIYIIAIPAGILIIGAVIIIVIKKSKKK
jgi:hypothetical protein